MTVDAQHNDTADQPDGLDLVRNEVEAEQADGYVTVTLVTEFGEADIRVPPLSKWRSTARNALFSRGDDMAWAVTTLSEDDAEAWMELDPTKGESEAFFKAWGEKTGSTMGESRASRRASARSRGQLKAI